MNRTDTEYLYHIDSNVVDITTGEIVFCYEVTNYTPTNYDICNRHYYKARDVEELNELVKKYNEKRYGEVTYHLDRKSLSKLYIPILTLCSKVHYYNVGFYTREEISKTFGIKESSINKFLNKLVSINLLKYTGIGLSSKNTIKIIWNPINVWKGYFGTTRTVAIEEWYRGIYGVEPLLDEFKESTIVDILSPVYVDKISPDPYVSPYFKDEYNNFRYIMDLSDAEFELQLLASLMEKGYDV